MHGCVAILVYPEFEYSLVLSPGLIPDHFFGNLYIMKNEVLHSLEPKLSAFQNQCKQLPSLYQNIQSAEKGCGHRHPRAISHHFLPHKSARP
jgi:hypothetical protein